MNVKELKKLAAACRKAGILHFKSSEYEFTLTDEVPAKLDKQKAAEKESMRGEFETDTLTDEALLFWSAGGQDSLVQGEES